MPGRSSSRAPVVGEGRPRAFVVAPPPCPRPGGGPEGLGCRSWSWHESLSTRPTRSVISHNPGWAPNIGSGGSSFNTSSLDIHADRIPFGSTGLFFSSSTAPLLILLFLRLKKEFPFDISSNIFLCPGVTLQPYGAWPCSVVDIFGTNHPRWHITSDPQPSYKNLQSHGPSLRSTNSPIYPLPRLGTVANPDRL